MDDVFEVRSQVSRGGHKHVLKRTVFGSVPERSGGTSEGEGDSEPRRPRERSRSLLDGAPTEECRTLRSVNRLRLVMVPVRLQLERERYERENLHPAAIFVTSPATEQ